MQKYIVKTIVLFSLQIICIIAILTLGGCEDNLRCKEYYVYETHYSYTPESKCCPINPATLNKIVTEMHWKHSASSIGPKDGSWSYRKNVKDFDDSTRGWWFKVNVSYYYKDEKMICE